MAQVDLLYAWLASGPTPDCDYIFSEALEHAEEGWAERIIEVLRQRGHDTSIAALIGCWDRLPETVRAQLSENRERLWRAITLATRFSSPRARLNALRALEGCITPRLAYLLPNLLRDQSDDVRELAARLLRRSAECYLEQGGDESDPSLRKQTARNLLRAVEDALRTYDVHKRVEALEVALWFARELGQELWQILHSTRSRAGNGVRENLVEWNHPRLADFLLLALRERGWEDEAAALLREWKSPDEITALLERHDLIIHRRWRTRLARVRQPRWLEEIGPDMEGIRPELRCRMPAWVRFAGFESQQRMALLSRWARSEDLALRRQAYYAIADLGGGNAHTVIRQAARREDALGVFARWYLAGYDSGLLDRSSDEQAAAERAAEGAMQSGELARLWQVCRRTPAGARGPLIETLREHVPIWREPLRQYLRSADPRDRVLALQVISTRELAVQFRLDLEKLLDDPIESIRRLAQLLVESLGTAGPAAPKQDTPPPHAQEPEPDALQGLQEALQRLEQHGASDENVAEVRKWLRRAYGPQTVEAESAT